MAQLTKLPGFTHAAANADQGELTRVIGYAILAAVLLVEILLAAMAPGVAADDILAMTVLP